MSDSVSIFASKIGDNYINFFYIADYYHNDHNVIYLKIRTQVNLFASDGWGNPEEILF